jgi:site-specific DNA-methyltransferase (adenine-specific)
MNITDKIHITNEDNMELMARYPDGYFQLAICDPPYGIGFDGENPTMVLNKSDKWKNKKLKGYKKKQWDKSIPEKEYFDELFRVSKNQIIWGGNYFNLPSTGGWIVWDKKKPDDFSLSQAELAWVKNSGRIAIFRYLWHGFQKEKPEERIHPTQKPIALYKWLLDKYAKQGDKILDTHLGSGSIALACHDYGFDLTACELDKEYYDAAIKRINNHVSQAKLFAL